MIPGLGHLGTVGQHPLKTTPGPLKPSHWDSQPNAAKHETH